MDSALTTDEVELWNESKCLNCGTDYDGSNPARLFCSATCRQAKHRERFRAFADHWDRSHAPREAVCEDCGSSFKAASRGSIPKRCTACKKAVHAARQRERYRSQRSA